MPLKSRNSENSQFYDLSPTELEDEDSFVVDNTDFGYLMNHSKVPGFSFCGKRIGTTLSANFKNH